MEPISSHPLYKAHTIDSAMNSLWEFYTKKFITLFLVSFVMGLILQYLSSMIRIDFSDYKTFNIDEMMLKLREYLWPMLIVSLTSLLFTTILHCYVVFNPLDKKNNILRCIVKSLRYFIPYLMIMIMLAFVGSFALFLGLLVVVIGALFAGIYIMTLYLFILPIMMVEGPNIAKTISRTIKLAHRDFWSNIGWTAVFVIIILVITMILSGLILLPFTGSFFSAVKNPEEATAVMDMTSKPLYIILSAMLNGLTLPLLPIFACILYFNGRAREDQQFFNEPEEDEYTGKVRVEDLYAKPLPENDAEKPENN
jgi:hypothetical protein